MNNPARILIVENDAVLVESLQETLTQMGYAVVGLAASGQQALELALAHKPDAILMDIRLRGPISGVQTAEQIHARLDIPIIYLTAFADEALLQQAKATEAYAYLVKPVRDRELRASLEITLYKHASEQHLKHLNQVLRAVRAVSQLITREQEAQHLLDEACKILLRTRGYRFVWIGQADGDILRPLSQAGDGQNLLQTIQSSTISQPVRKLPGNEVLRGRQNVVCADMLNDERYAPWQTEVIKAGFQSTVAMPMLLAGKLYGVLIVYSDQPNFFDEEEIDLLSELANDIAFGLKSIADQAERKQVEDALAEGEARFHGLFQNAPIGLFHSLPEGRFLRANLAMARMLGYASPDELISSTVDMSCQIYADPQQRPKVMDIILNQDNWFHDEVTLRHKDGSCLLVDMSGRRVLKADGSIAYLEGVVQDITERERGKAALRESEQQYHSVIAAISEGLVVQDQTDKIILGNESAARILGLSMDQLLGRSSFDPRWQALHEDGTPFRPQDHPSIITLRSGQPVDNTIMDVHISDGKRAIISINSRPLLDDHGNVTRVVASFTDITARKQAEEALRKSEATVKAIIDSTSDMIWSVDPVSFGLLAFNQGLRNYFLNSRNISISIGMRPEDLLPTQEFIQRWRDFYQRALREGVYTTEYDVFSANKTLLLNFHVLKREDDIFGISVFGKDITDRKQAEEALRKSEAKFVKVFATTPAAMSINDLRDHGRYVEVNAAFMKITGYQQDELIGHTSDELRLYVEPQIRVEILRQIRTQSRIRDLEYRFRRKNGDIGTGLLNVELVEVEGKLLALAATVDITERKQTEEQLQLLKHSIDSALDGVYWMDRDGRFLYVNDAGCKALGYTREELLKMRVVDVNLRATPQRWAQLWQDLREQKNSTIQSLHHRKDGSEFPVEISSTHLKFGEQEFFSGFAKDITERVRGEERIQQSEKKYRDLFQVNKDGIAIFVLSPDPAKQRFVEINEAAHLMLGLSREEMLQLSPSALEPSLTLQEVRARQIDFESKGAANFEAVLAHKDGHAIYTEFTAQLIQYEGQPAIMNIVRDITERKQRERELQVIAALSAALRTAPTRARMLPVIVAQMVNLLKADAATVEIVDAQTGDVVTEAADGAWINLLGSRQTRGTGINAIISATLKPYYTPDLENDPNLFYHDWARAGIHGSAGVPLIAQEKLIGFIWIGHKTEIAHSEIQLLGAIADITANAIQRSTLYDLTLRDAADLEMAYDTTLEGWARALELRDQETEGHTRRVVQTTLQLARSLGFSETEIEHIRRGALLHDIGKMGVPDSILLKPGKLSKTEWVTMRRHPEYARQLLASIDYLKPALNIPYCHHEKWDGTGYPRGLRGAEIPLAARIFAIVDVWDALTSDRPYRPAWTSEDALAYIREQDGKHFDPKIVEVFIKLIGEPAE